MGEDGLVGPMPVGELAMGLESYASVVWDDEPYAALVEDAEPGSESVDCSAPGPLRLAVKRARSFA